MKLIDAINEVNDLKPNMYGLPEKIRWLSRLDMRIFRNIFLTHELSEEEMEPFLPEEETEAGEETPAVPAITYPDPPFIGPSTVKPDPAAPKLVFNGYTEEDTEKELIVKAPYDQMYIHWLSEQIDWNNREFLSYNNENAMFEATYAAFRDEFNRTHMPLGTQKIFY